MRCPMPQANDLGKSLTVLDQDSTLIAVMETSRWSRQVAGIVPGIERLQNFFTTTVLIDRGRCSVALKGRDDVEELP